MKNFLMMCVLFFVIGCIQLKTSPDSKFYTLRILDAPQKKFLSQDICICLEDIQVPSYLDKSQIITRSQDGMEIFVEEFYRWSEPFPKEFYRIIQENLSKIFPNAFINLRNIQLKDCDYTVFLEVYRFDGVMGENCIMEGRIRILNKKHKTVLQKYINKSSITKNSYTSYVHSIEVIANQVAWDIANEIKSLFLPRRSKTRSIS